MARRPAAGAPYLPSDVSGRPILLVPGVHAAGIAEPRLINFAREIAATGHPVTTAELPDLANYQITAAHDGHDRRRGHLAGDNQTRADRPAIDDPV